MSKHDYSAKKTEDRSEQLLSSDAFEPEKSGLSKEIKLSLAAITVLLGVLGYVLYGHFLGSDEESGDIAAATAGEEDKTPADVSGSTDPSMASGYTTPTATTESRWGGTTGQEPPSTSESATSSAAPGFSYMPPAAGRIPAAPSPMPQTATDRYAAYGGSSMVETPTNTWSSDATAEPSPDSGQTHDPFQRRTTQDTAGSYASQRQSGGYSSWPQTGSQTYSNWQSGSQSSSPATETGTADVSSDTDTTTPARLGQSTTSQNQASQRGDLTDNAATGANVLRQSASRYSTDSHRYVASNTYGYTGGSGSTQVESRSASQGYNDYNASAQSSVPRASADFSTVSTSPDSSQYDFSDAAASNGKYTIQPNDNYGIISKKQYDTESYFKALAHHNRAAFPDSNRLDVGKEIETPDEAELVRLYPDLCPTPEHRDAMRRRMAAAGTVSRLAGANVYVVQEGDTLFDIARYELGKASRWAEIYRLNRDRMGKDFDYLTPGLKLVMPSESVPSDQPVGAMTQRSGALR
jgi:nucleoid-associated protein YgaU